MSDESYTQAEIVRSLKRIEEKQKENGRGYASVESLRSYRELADQEHKDMRDDIAGIRDGLKWAFRLGVTLVGTELLAIIAYIIEQSIRSKP